tara:strand:- start:649 stop:834 length:186 start_codon:yes stop_codon:yes gene_type:complete
MVVISEGEFKMLTKFYKNRSKLATKTMQKCKGSDIEGYYFAKGERKAYRRALRELRQSISK